MGGEPRLKLALTRSGNGMSSLSWWMAKRTSDTRSVKDAFAAGAFDFGFFQRGVGVPELGFVPQVGRLFDGVGEFFHGLEGEAVFVGLAVEHLQGGDFVFVVLNELLEGLDHAFGAVEGFGEKPLSRTSSALTWSMVISVLAFSR